MSLAVFRNMGYAAFQNIARRMLATVLTSKPRRFGWAKVPSRIHQFRLSVALDPRDPPAPLRSRTSNETTLNHWCLLIMHIKIFDNQGRALSAPPAFCELPG